MKKKVFIIMAMAAFATVALIGSMVWAQTTKSGEVADVLKIHDPLFGKYKNDAANFPHKHHSVDQKIACQDCHHVYKDGKNTWKEGDKVQKCSACHKSPKKDEGKLLSLYNAFHKNCKDCHKEEKKKGNKKATTSCTGCHPKKK